MSDSLAISLHASGTETVSGSGAAVDLWEEPRASSWAASTEYSLGDIVSNDGEIYYCSYAGTSATSGGPTGTETDAILDGTAYWHWRERVQTRRAIEVRTVVSAVSGSSPILAITIQTSADAESWRDVDTLAARTAAGTWCSLSGDFDRYARAVWTITGTDPSFTFALTGEAVENFCPLSAYARLEGQLAEVIADRDTDKQIRLEHLLAATQEARGYLLRHNTPPIVRVGRDVLKATSKIATLAILTDGVGVSADANATALVVEEARGRVSWLKDVSRGMASADVVDSTPAVIEGSGSIASATTSGRTRRGWGDITI